MFAKKGDPLVLSIDLRFHTFLYQYNAFTVESGVHVVKILFMFQPPR